MEALSEVAFVVYEAAAPLWAEILFAIFFALNFTWMRQRISGPKTAKGGKKTPGGKVDHYRAIPDQFKAGDYDAIIATWKSRKDDGPTPPEALRFIVRAIFAQEMDKASEGRCIDDIIEHMKRHGDADMLGNDKPAAFVLEACSMCSQGTALMQKLWDAMQEKLGLEVTATIREAFLTAHAYRGDQAAAAAVTKEMQAAGESLSVRGYSNVIRGFMSAGLLDSALQYLTEMSERFNPHQGVVSDLVKLAVTKGRSREVLERTRKLVSLPAEAIAHVLEDCLARSDLQLATLAEEMAIESKTALNLACYDPLLKLFAEAGDMRAISRFEQMQKAGLRPSDGLYVGLISRCAAPRFRRFAELLVTARRSKGKLTLNMYSALMKVYAYDKHYAKACQTYEELLEDGLEPDPVMCGCLIRFAVDGHRTDLLPQLAAKLPTIEVQHYVLMIRACAQSKDVDAAFNFFKQLRDEGKRADTKAYNALLDVCASSGDMERAMEVLREMDTKGVVDEVSYNILTKGYCGGGCNSEKVTDLLQIMEKSGFMPNATTYNCLINSDIQAGRMDKAWEKVDMMTTAQVEPDSYTFATLLKALKSADISYTARTDLERAMTLMDRSSVDVCKDEVLLVTTLEALMKQRSHGRLSGLLDKFHASPLGGQAKFHARGIAIKANGLIGRVDRCRELWETMEDRAAEAGSVVIGCILNAFVVNQCVQEAVDLFRKIEADGIETNAIMYSTLLKGYVQSNEAEAAFHLVKEMRTKKLQISPSCYQHVIDAQVKAGAHDRAEFLQDTTHANVDTTVKERAPKSQALKGAPWRKIQVHLAQAV